MMISIKLHDIDAVEPSFYPAAPKRDMFGTVCTRSRDGEGEVDTFYYNTDDIRRHIAALEDLARMMDEHQKTEGVEL